MIISTLGWYLVLGSGNRGMEHRFTNVSVKASTYEGKIKL
jgi:hypothetical protein